MNRCLSFFLFCFFFLLNGCSVNNGSGNTQPSALISVYAMSPDAPKVNVFINDANTATSLPFGNYTLYTQATAGSTKIRVQTASESVLLDTSITTSAGVHYSLFLTDTFSALKHTFITDNIGTATDTLYLRFFNFSPDAPPVDFSFNTDSVNNSNHITLWKNRSIGNDITNDSINKFVGSKLGTYYFYAIRSGTTDTLARFLGKDLSIAGYYTLYLDNRFRVPTDSANVYDTTLQLGIRLN